MANYETREFWACGRRDGLACIRCFIYEGSIVASAERDKITEYQMHKALRGEFPDTEFSVSHQRGPGLYMVAILR